MLVATVRDRNERISRDLQLPGDTPIAQLIPQLITTMSLPARDQQGKLLPYALILRDNGYILPDDQTLISLGIASGRILLLVVPTPDERLRSTKVRSVVAAPAAAPLPSTVGAAVAVGDAPLAGITFNRPPRIRVHLPDEEVLLPKPPTTPSGSRRLDVVALIFPVFLFGILAVLLLVVIPKVLPQQNFFSPIFLVYMGVFALLNPVGQMLSFWVERRRIRKEQREQEEDYRQLLAKLRSKLDAQRIEQHRARRASSPSVRKLRSLVDERIHLWERRPDDDDFLHLRMGKTTLPSTVKVKAPDAGDNSELQNEAEALAKEFEYVSDVPITLPLPQLGSVGVTGARGPVVDFARALVCHLAVHHSPDEVRILGIYPYEQSREWEWLKWMPHTNHFRPGAQNKMLAFTPDQIEELLNEVTEEIGRREARKEEEKDGGEVESQLPYLVLLVDDYNRVRDHVGLSEVLRHGRGLNLSAIVLVDSRQDIPGDCGAILEVPSYEQMIYSVAGAEGEVKDQIAPDRVDRGTGENIARSLAPIRVSGSQGPGNIKTSVRLLDLLNLEAADQLEPRTWWGEQPRFGRLTVPIGEKSGGPLLLDLTDTAHGPHGLVAGTTGSGKSELLQTLIAALAVTHHPHLINFVLVDFKGGSAFKDFENIPHTVGMVSDLHGRLAERALVALKSELKRREHILHEANAVNITQYQAMRARDPNALPPMPSLLIVIDEFAELAKELPEFMGGLISVVQKGRSLGVHLILATQRPAGVVSANIWSNVKFRICLRVASVDDSREMLGRSDAALLPHNLPGRGYFQVGAEIFDQFQVARVAGAYRPATPRDAKKQAEIAELTRAGHIHNIGSGKSARAGAGVVTDDRSELQVMMTQMEPFKESLGAALFRPWPDPLPSDLTLPDMFQLAGKPALNGTRWEARPAFGWLNAPIGLLDLPAEQKQDVFMLDLLRFGGHALIAGSAGVGKSFLLRTITTALAMTHSPTDLNLYLIDFGGQTLRVFEKLPHVGGVFNSADSDRIRRLFRKLRGIIEERKVLFREQRVDSFLAYHNRPSAANQPQKPLPAIVVVIDRFAEFRAVHETEMPDLVAIAREGRGYGIHLVIAVDRPGIVPNNLAGNLELRYSLRLADPNDSLILLGKGDATTLDPNTPGRGLRRGRRLEEFQTALPVVGDGDDEQSQQLETLSARAAQAWKGTTAESIQLLPEYVSLPDLLTQAPTNGQTPKTEGLRVPLGLDDLTLRPVWGELNPDAQHFLIAGSAGSGKTALLRTWLLGLAQRYSPAEAQIILVDLRRTSRALRSLPHMKGYVENEVKLNEVLEGLKKELTERAQRLSSGSSSKTSPTPIVLVIDDFELVAALPKNPGTELKDVARQARDLGLHVIIAGNNNDISKSFDPLTQQAKAVRSGIVLSADPQETPLLGVRLADLPPGRGVFVQRNSRNLMQTAFLEPEAVGVWLAQIRGGGVSIKG
ncbi:MAG TPA: type VII secretion protein EssC [Ktedonobacterales bacterium]|jgi:S-DNA-T family DNA segregation ATPase FtsK/SpoIIIE